MRPSPPELHLTYGSAESGRQAAIAAEAHLAWCLGEGPHPNPVIRDRPWRGCGPAKARRPVHNVIFALSTSPPPGKER
jgi:hypothetical protein